MAGPPRGVCRTFPGLPGGLAATSADRVVHDGKGLARRRLCSPWPDRKLVTSGPFGTEPRLPGEPGPLPLPFDARPGRRPHSRMVSHPGRARVGPVEDGDPAPPGHGPLVPPQEVLVKLPGRGLLEGPDLHRLRVDPGHHVLDRAVLARGSA